MNLVSNPGVTMSSREIADLVEARHNDVVATITRLFEKGLLRSSRKTRSESTGGRPIEVYDLIERDTHLVVAGYSDEHRARVIDRWQQLEQATARLPAPADLSRMQILQLAMESEQARLQAEGERDHAIATKAQIGQRREATAMATASAAVREAGKLRNELGRGCQQATVTAVEIALNQKLGKQAFRPLKRWCDAQGVVASFVQDARYGRVRAWPAAAWLNIYNIDLASLFSGEEVSA